MSSLSSSRKKAAAPQTPEAQLLKAARSGSLISVMRLLQMGVDPNACLLALSFNAVHWFFLGLGSILPQVSDHLFPLSTSQLGCAVVAWGAEGSMRSLQAAVASGSIDVCAALLLHGASLEVDLAIPGIPAEVRSLLELFKGRPPQAGDRNNWTRLGVNTVLIWFNWVFRFTYYKNPAWFFFFIPLNAATAIHSFWFKWS